MSKLVYYRLLRQFFEELRFDLMSNVRSGRRALARERGMLDGKKVIIVCNGPSLLSTEFDLLDGVFCIGLNKINLIFEKTRWRPNCIVAVNQKVMKQNEEFFRQSEIPLYLNRRLLTEPGGHPRASYLNCQLPSGQFSTDASQGVCQGFTVTYVALQLAYHFGAKETAVIGCDHNFVASGSPNSEATANGPDRNHFDPNYFTGGVSWDLPDLESSEYHYRLALRAFEQDGRRLFNCTDGGKLEIFPRLTLREFLEL
ncbi:MAG: hypothetical protein AAF664_23070 [Planctomycetota bacterium]